MIPIVVAVFFVGLFLGFFVFRTIARMLLGPGASTKPVVKTWATLTIVSTVLAVAPLALAQPDLVLVVALIQIVVTLVLLQRMLGFSLGRAFGFMAVVTIVGGVASLMISLPVRAYLMQAFRVPTGSMEPTFQVNDYFLVDKRPSTRQNLRRGDVIVFPFPDDPSDEYFKRIVGLPGDEIRYEQKQLFVNGQLMKEPHVQYADGDRTRPGRDNLEPIDVPPGQLFVMGDNRDRSSDSRYWGFLEADTVIGVAWLVYAPWNRVRFLERPSEQ